jgi:hypothetical protein
MTLLTSHGIMLMKSLEHQARFEVTTFQDKLIRMRAQEVEEGEEDAND